MKYVSVLIICFFFQLLSCFSQDLEFKNFSNDEGLSNNYVRFIYQDSYGYVWIGTNEGVDRFDGKNFLSLKKEINSNIATSICQINNTIMWIGTNNGIVVYNQVMRKKLYDHKKFIQHSVQGIHKIADTLLCISSNKGLFLYNTNTDNVQTIYEHQVFQSVLYDNNVYFITKNSIQGYSIKTGTFRTFQLLQNPAKDFKIIGVVKHSLCISQENKGITTYSIETSQFRNFFSQIFHFSNSIIEYNNDIWIATRNGIAILDSAWNFKTILYDKVNPTFKGKNVLHVFVDNQKNIWVGTEFNGINICYNNQKRIKHYSYNMFNSQSIQDNQINAIVEISPNVFILGSSIGLIRFDKNKEIFTKISGFEKDVLSFCLYKNTLLFGAKEGLFQMDLLTYKITKVAIIPEITIYKIVQYKNSFLIGSWGEGLWELSLNFSSVSKFAVSSKYEQNTVFDILIHSPEEVWLATFGEGLVRIKNFSNVTNRKVEKYTKENSQKFIPANEVLTIFKTNDNKVWLGIAGQGIFVYDIYTDTFKKLANSMGQYFLCAVQFFEHNNTICFNNSGITIFDKYSKVSHTFGIDYGAQSNYFNMNAGCKSQDGTILMGGINGLNVFLPQELTSFEKSECTAVISKLLIQNTEITTDYIAKHGNVIHKAIEFVDTIHLSYLHENIQFYISALRVKNPDILQFKYKIGENSEWIDMDKGQHVISLTQLKPGTISLYIKCKDQIGEWSVTEKQVCLIIYPPFWKTTWFYSIIIIILIGIIYSFIKIRERQLIIDKKRLEKKVDERTQEILHQKEELQLQSELLIQNNNDLSRSNRMIRDSIFYAKRIQDAILPASDFIQTYLPNSFVFFKPRDIVSGDFYWFKEQNDLLYIVAADCTGHGVPGAFMSMIGSTLLQDIIREDTLLNPAQILTKLDAGIVLALNQTSDCEIESPDDGMDIAICIIDKRNQVIQISAANQQVLYLCDDSMKIIEGDIFSVGGIFTSNSKKCFTNYEIMYQNGARLYLFSDGYQDQFGGPLQKKFQANRLISLVNEMQNMPFDEQYKVVESTFNGWKGNNKQIDDVLVIGLELL